MAEEVVIRISKCDECPFMKLMFTHIGMAVMTCELIDEEEEHWHLGGGIPSWCPFREGGNVKKTREPSMVSHHKCRGY